MENLSRAYVRAVAARAGVICGTIETDFGMDLLLRAVQRYAQQYWDDGPQLDLQLKSTTRAEVKDTEIVYDLEVRAYNLLRRANPEKPRILVLLVLPEDEALWLSQSAEELILRRCAYWLSLKGVSPTDNVATVRITIPKTNVFSVEVVRQLLNLPGGGMP
jgi:hypothetical protein